ncbi:MAG: SDR family oxidoreductase [Armatimonadetes bacterium]|nr:SDR family oxidoreductase [Armatimonadota bacterium]
MRLKDRIALITGAGAGIGRASVMAFTREGAHVVAVDVNESTAAETVALARGSAGEAVVFRADVSRSAEVQAMIRFAVERYGGLDILFNNAGIVQNGTVTETPEDEWEQTMAINLRSVFLGCKYAIPEMRRRGGGVIINTASVAGLVGVRNRASYSASKMGIVGLTRSIAIDYIQDNIRANAICPGTVDTPSLRQRIAQAEDPEAARIAFLARQPMGRLGTPEEIAALAVYLAAEESAYMTGSATVIDGGLSL